jgi:acyl-CoA synthetase (AMP-forming)/AMP-acid ligase II
MEPLPARLHPFDSSGCTRHPDGIVRYQDRPRSLVEMLRASVARSPSHPALIEVGGDAFSYAALWERAARVSGGLRDRGVERGDRVAIRLGNGIDWCLAFFGVQMRGAIAVPVNTRFTDIEASYVLTDSGSRFVFASGQPLPDGHPFVDETARPDDVAAIFYTSGTTGFSKGAMLTHEGFLSNTETCRRVGLLPRGEAVRNLVSVPLFHVTGCNSQLLPTCEAGGTTVIMPAFDVPAFLATIERERIDATLAVPAIYWRAMNDSAFARCDTSSVRWLGYGGAPIAPDLVGRVLEAFPNARVANAFGLTETSSVTTCLPHEFARTRPDSVGLAAPVIDLAVGADEGEPGAPEVGELLVRGPNVVPGYWNKPDATAETFAGGWLHTGDVARIDADGFVCILDRRKDMINRGGEKVYCVEVESALVAHPAVFESAVIGVPDEMMGEKVGAVIVLKPGHHAGVGEILESVRTRLARFKVPQFVVLQTDLLPRNPGGKILKKTLRQTISWGDPVS